MASYSEKRGSSNSNGSVYVCNLPEGTDETMLAEHFGIIELLKVLLALERIEQDEELSHELEQLLALETSLFLNGLSFHDQHRDMRLDIDNMSYEELLALEDKMGTVSTALTDDAIGKCLKSSIYKISPLEAQALGMCEDDKKDDSKCSICQEEYEEGDEVGKLVQSAM